MRAGILERTAGGRRHATPSSPTPTSPSGRDTCCSRSTSPSAGRTPAPTIRSDPHGLLRTRTRRRAHRHGHGERGFRRAAARTPLLAALGAGDAAVAAVAKAVLRRVRRRDDRAARTVQHRVAELPTELEGLRARFSGDELRRAAGDLPDAGRARVREFAGRGEETLGKLREQPQVRQAFTRVDEAQEAAEPGRWRPRAGRPGSPARRSPRRGSASPAAPPTRSWTPVPPRRTSSRTPAPRRRRSSRTPATRPHRPRGRPRDRARSRRRTTGPKRTTTHPTLGVSGGGSPPCRGMTRGRARDVVLAGGRVLHPGPAGARAPSVWWPPPSPATPSSTRCGSGPTRSRGRPADEERLAGHHRRLGAVPAAHPAVRAAGEPHLLRARAVVPGPAQQHDAVLAGRRGRDARLPRRRAPGGRRGAAGGPALVPISEGCLVRPRHPGPDARSRPPRPARRPRSPPRSRPSTRPTPRTVGVAEIDPALADTAAFCAAYGSPMDGSANCVVVAGRRGEDDPLRRLPGAGHHPRRRQRARAAAAGRAQGLVRADGRRGGADGHGVRRDHPARAARRLAAAGRRRGGRRAGRRDRQRAAGARSWRCPARCWPRCPAPRSSRAWPAAGLIVGVRCALTADLLERGMTSTV